MNTVFGHLYSTRYSSTVGTYSTVINTCKLRSTSFRGDASASGHVHARAVVEQRTDALA